MSSKLYNEYKFHVSQDQLPYVINVLQGLCGHTDPYPEGIVDSIYYDSLDFYLYGQCLDGARKKTKFRIRGYGDNKFHQVHQKNKDMSVVSKFKARIHPVSSSALQAPNWSQIFPVESSRDVFERIISNSSKLGPLQPVIRVRYYRYRFRIFDYRITLDTNIEVMGFANGIDSHQSYGVLPSHVLEVKTIDARPYLPLLGLSKLPQISFSKFFLGLNLLANGSELTTI